MDCWFKTLNYSLGCQWMFQDEYPSPLNSSMDGIWLLKVPNRTRQDLKKIVRISILPLSRL